MVPQGQFHPPPLFACGKTYPLAVRNGLLRREGAAETTSWVPGPRNAFFQKLCICAKYCRRPTETITGPQNEAEGETGGVFAIAILNRAFLKAVFLRRRGTRRLRGTYYTAGRVAATPWVRPGSSAGRARQRVAARPDSKPVRLGSAGVVTGLAGAWRRGRRVWLAGARSDEVRKTSFLFPGGRSWSGRPLREASGGRRDGGPSGGSLAPRKTRAAPRLHTAPFRARAASFVA